MLDLDENLKKLNSIKDELLKLKETINLENLQKELSKLQEETTLPDF